jgi:perosamine synthetase
VPRNPIPFARPDFDEAEARAVTDVLRSGWVSQGPKVAEFERLFAERVGAGTAVATSSCTTALHLALVLAGIGRGDEVICPSYTFIATANAIMYTGATPVFADIDPDTWNVDPADALRRITARTRAIVPVHQVGLAADLAAFEPARESGVRIIEDAACAAGATYRARPVGSHGNVACWSFHPRKTVTMGEGGMMTTDDLALAEEARRLRSFGASVSDHVRHEAKGLLHEEYATLGYNYRMTDLQAAIGIEQLAKLDALVARRREIARRYDDAFAPVQTIQVPARPPYAEHAFQSYGIRLRRGCPVDRDVLIERLIAEGIACRRGISPVHLEPLYRQRADALSLPITEAVAARSLFLPIFASLAGEDQLRIIETVLDAVTG